MRRTNQYSLGIELSTQSLKMTVLDIYSSVVIHTDSIEYDTAFPSYGTFGGVLPSVEPLLRHTSPLMLLDALDTAFSRLRRSGISLGAIGAIKADGMQHCTVYAADSFFSALRRLSVRSGLAEQLGPYLTRWTSPIWEDRTTAAEAEFLENFMATRGGAAALTGNRVELRFPAAQIMKWGSEDPAAFNSTGGIFVLSAFITAVLTGSDAPVDTGDGWGTNLNSIDIERPGWSDEALAAADTYLATRGVTRKLGEMIGTMTHYDEPEGIIHPYFAEKYGVNPAAVVLAGTGDNPATLLGCGGETVISLGSSYTVNGVMDRIVPSCTGEYNVFGFTRGRAMALSVFTNGSKVHEMFLRRYLCLSGEEEIHQEHWSGYIRMAGRSVVSDDEKLMLPYLFDESVPLRKGCVVRDGFSEDDAAANVRALHLSQALSLRLHSGHLREAPAICLVGGASHNPLLRQFIADAFGTRGYSVEHAAFAAPMGCAVSGARHILGCDYTEAAKRFIRVDHEVDIVPDSGNARTMEVLLRRYEELEKI